MIILFFSQMICLSQSDFIQSSLFRPVLFVKIPGKFLKKKYCLLALLQYPDFESPPPEKAVPDLLCRRFSTCSKTLCMNTALFADISGTGGAASNNTLNGQAALSKHLQYEKHRCNIKTIHRNHYI